MSVDESHKFAIEIAVQTIILLIGLSASIITFTATFAQTSKQKNITCLERSSWICMIISIVFGIVALLKIIGNTDTNRLEIYETYTCLFAGVQIILFWVGLFFLMMMSKKR